MHTRRGRGAARLLGCEQPTDGTTESLRLCADFCCKGLTADALLSAGAAVSMAACGLAVGVTAVLAGFSWVGGKRPAPRFWDCARCRASITPRVLPPVGVKLRTGRARGLPACRGWNGTVGAELRPEVVAAGELDTRGRP